MYKRRTAIVRGCSSDDRRKLRVHVSASSHKMWGDHAMARTFSARSEETERLPNLKCMTYFGLTKKLTPFIMNMSIKNISIEGSYENC